MKVLVINAGSSSLKYQLMDPATREVFAKGICERIGIDGKLTHKVPATDSKYVSELDMPTHAEAIKAVMSALTDQDTGVISSMEEIDAVGHRVVHGGEKFATSVRIDSTVWMRWRPASLWPRSITPPTSWASRLAKPLCPACPWWPCLTPLSTRPCPP